MDRKKACQEIIELFIRLANKYRSMEKIPVDYGGEHSLYHSERHMLDQVGDHPEMNMTEFARMTGVTKGAVSQVVKKLETKGVVRRYKRIENEKEVLIELTELGREIYDKHKTVNEESTSPLYEELRKYSDDKVYFLLDMFNWFDSFLDSAREGMMDHSKEKQ